MAGTYSFGWRPDYPDHRDLIYSAPLAVLRQLPPSADLRGQCPAVYDQGRIGSCTANAIGGAIHFDRMKESQSPDFVPSRLFIYYNERAMEHSVPYDAGAQIRDGIKTVNKLGVCPEDEWAYSDDGFPKNEGDPFEPGAPAAQKPPDQAYKDALGYQVTRYLRLNQTLPQLRGCLADGYPFVFGFSVFENFFGADGKPQTEIPMPAGGRIGGHAVLAVGYDDASSKFIVRNSWGPDVHDHGYFYMPYAYVTEPTLTNDIWTVRAVEA
jgi:C1A family cysteine protease